MLVCCDCDGDTPCAGVDGVVTAVLTLLLVAGTVTVSVGWAGVAVMVSPVLTLPSLCTTFLAPSCDVVAVVGVSSFVKLRYIQRPPKNSPINIAAVSSKLPIAKSQARPVLS